VVEACLTHTCARHHSLHLLRLEERQDYTWKGQLHEDNCLKISVADPDPGSGVFWNLNPGSGVFWHLDPGSGSRMNNPYHISESLKNNFLG
jgi:hypothetical protein